MITIKRYNPLLRREWQEFIATTTNATFLHNRDYMEYHSDRFEDFSLMAYDDRAKLIAVLPANRRNNELWSHQGLTYGGWLMAPKHVVPQIALELWQTTVSFLAAEGITTLHYKPVPWFYCSYPTEDDLYCLWRLGAIFEAVQQAAVIPLHRKWLLNDSGRQNLHKAASKGIVVDLESDFSQFWEILSQRLDERYNTAPVHTLDEMHLLQSRFPENIRLYTARLEDTPTLLAGILVYATNNVVHSQYISSTPLGRKMKTLPAILDRIFQDYSNCNFFDFGTSCEQGGKLLNAGLSEQKYGLGGRTAVYSTLRLDISSQAPDPLQP